VLVNITGIGIELKKI